MKTSDIKKLGEAWASVTSSKEDLEEAKKANEDNTNDKSDDGEGLDKVQPKAVKKKFKDRKDKDIDNDGDVDSSDEYLHKRRKAVSKAIANEEDENGDEENGDKKKKPFPPKKDDDKGEEEKGDEEKSDDEGDEEAPKKDDKKDDKKKVATSPKTAEISKIGETFNISSDDLLTMLETAAKQQKSNATPPEAIDSKESPKSKEFIAKHKKSEKKYEDDEEDGHDKTFKAGQATKAKSGKRPQDNPAGDNNVVNPVKEETELEEKALVVDEDGNEGSVSFVELARRQLAGENAKKEQQDKNPFDARTTAARQFLERMMKKYGK